MLKEEEQELLLEKELSEKVVIEPLSIKDKRSLLDLFSPFLCKLFGRDRIEFTHKNMNTLLDLSNEGSILFDINDSLHVMKLENLHKSYFVKSLSLNTNVADDLSWKELGFQTSKPSTDFRGGGLLSLHALIYLIKKEADLVKEIVAYNNNIRHDFLLACALVTGVFVLKNFFHFGLYYTYKKSRDKKNICGIKPLKVFLDLIDKDKETFLKFSCAWLRLLFIYWKQQCDNNSCLSIVDFKSAEEVVAKHYKIKFEEFASQVNQRELSTSMFLQVLQKFTIKQPLTAYLDQKII